jgi:hypothetical protein
MSYYRDYTPVYDHTPEDKKQIVQAMLLKNSKRWYRRHTRTEKNPQPYNKYKNMDAEVEHLTIRYNEKTTNQTKEMLKAHYNKNWYTIIEHAPEDKSIDLPHFHAIRRIATFTNM